MSEGTSTVNACAKGLFRKCPPSNGMFVRLRADGVCKMACALSLIAAVICSSVMLLICSSVYRGITPDDDFSGLAGAADGFFDNLTDGLAGAADGLAGAADGLAADGFFDDLTGGLTDGVLTGGVLTGNLVGAADAAGGCLSGNFRADDLVICLPTLTVVSTWTAGTRRLTVSWGLMSTVLAARGMCLFVNRPALLNFLCALAHEERS